MFLRYWWKHLVVSVCKVRSVVAGTRFQRSAALGTLREKPSSLGLSSWKVVKSQTFLYDPLRGNVNSQQSYCSHR